MDFSKINSALYEQAAIIAARYSNSSITDYHTTLKAGESMGLDIRDNATDIDSTLGYIYVGHFQASGTFKSVSQGNKSPYGAYVDGPQSQPCITSGIICDTGTFMFVGYRVMADELRFRLKEPVILPPPGGDGDGELG